MPKRKLLQIGNITPRMASRLEADFDIIEYFKFENKKKIISENEKEIVCVPVSYTHLTLPTIYSV